MGFPCGSAGKESACNVGDLGSIPVGKIHWRRERLPTPVFWPEEFHVLYSPWVSKESDTTDRLSLYLTSQKAVQALGMGGSPAIHPSNPVSIVGDSTRQLGLGVPLQTLDKAGRWKGQR